MSTEFEVNFDGLVGPTHNYGGLSFGNRASMAHGHDASRPKAAALQGLEKMRTLAEKGYAQAVLPPLFRPNRELLSRLGFTGNLKQQLDACREFAPNLFASVWSASSMWTANAATVFPSLDTTDGRLRFVPASLTSQFHRSLEATATRDQLRQIFAHSDSFEVCEPLPSHDVLGDEGAANHTRFVGASGSGLHFFVYGTGGADIDRELKFPARQSFEASAAVARLGGIDLEQALFAKQSPEAINAGVFHNDVIAVGYGDVLFCHEQAYADQDRVLSELKTEFESVSGFPLQVVEVPKRRVSLEDAVSSYLFNSQLLERNEGGKLLVVPIECRENPAVASYLDELVDDPSSPIRELLVFNLRQSMRNGGGPACLRLRVQMNEVEREALSGRVFIDDALYGDLTDWVERHYRDELTVDAFEDMDFVVSCHSAFSELSEILELPGIRPAAL